MTRVELAKLVKEAVQMHYDAPTGVTFSELIAKTIRMGAEHERHKWMAVAECVCSEVPLEAILHNPTCPWRDPRVRALYLDIEAK